MDAPEAITLPWAQDLLDAAIAGEQGCDEQVGLVAALRDGRRRELEDATSLEGRQQRRAGALARAQRLQLERPRVLALQVEVDAAARAAEVAGVLAAVTERRARRDIALVEERSARAQVGPKLAERVAGGVSPEGDGRSDGGDVLAWRSALAREQERAGRLAALAAVDRTHQSAVLEASQARDDQADALAAVGETELALSVLPTRRVELTGQLAAARAAATRVPTVRAERDRLVALRPDVIALAQQTAREQVLRDQVLAARETSVALSRKALDLRVANVNSMIARLSANLVDGIPCDVCGSPEHPDPSALRDEGVSTDDEDRARREADLAEEQVARLLAEQAGVHATCSTLAARVGPLTLDVLDDHIAGLDLELGALEQAVVRLEQAEADLSGLDEQRAALGQQHVALTARADHAGRRAADADQRATQALAGLREELGDDLSLGLTAVLAAVERRVEVVAALLAAVQQTSACTDDLERASAQAESACAAAGFAGADEAVSAMRDEDWRVPAMAMLRTHADAAASVAADLADPALDVPLDPVAPVAAAIEALALADDVLAVAVAEQGQARQRRTALGRLVPELASLLTDLAPLEQRATEIRQLADLCAGQGANGLKMTLSSFVLAARLEEVAEAASGRLLRMTQGRYTLVHTDGAARGNQRSGLGLLVRDGWSGQDRDTSTLSGGETFLAALALALGLADVVAAEAGGARIGALFVDEGFGTLDEETLDEVMDVLDSLREGGRIVGLVSHVADLRQRIPAQVQVTKTRTGSDLQLVGC